MSEEIKNNPSAQPDKMETLEENQLFMTPGQIVARQFFRNKLAVFGLVVVYCLRSVNLFPGSHGLPEAISIALVTALHLWKRQMLLSIAGGMVCYMLLVQLIFY